LEHLRETLVATGNDVHLGVNPAVRTSNSSRFLG
jgi:hypothetical protein